MASTGSGGVPCVPSKLTVDELREELKLRALPTGGAKPGLIKRLEEALVAPDAVTYRLSQAVASAPRPKKRSSNKKKPVRSEYATQEEFDVAWEKWRQCRDHNNESVKRSRIMAKKKREEQERLYKDREQQNAQLEAIVSQMRTEVSFLNKVLKTPELLDHQELKQLEDLLARGMPQ
eukprot:m.21073 g.21073  ORF g.21073 m.21073 type:complete len:177 (+) comp8239_c0_seq2:577-1107(+)